MRAILLALLLLLAPLAAAQELLLLGISHHFNTDRPHQERNYGLGIHGNAFGINGLSIGAYRNSDDRRSIFVAKDWLELPLADHVRLSVPLVAVTGYHAPVIVTPLPVFNLEISRRASADVLLIPPIGSHMGILAAQLRVRF